jgi:hypothetical protein
MALHDPDIGITAVVVPAEQYLELVTSYVRDRGHWEMQLDGRAASPEGMLSAFGVEQVNPQESWLRIGATAPGQPSPEG